MTNHTDPATEQDQMAKQFLPDTDKKQHAWPLSGTESATPRKRRPFHDCDKHMAGCPVHDHPENPDACTCKPATSCTVNHPPDWPCNVCKPPTDEAEAIAVELETASRGAIEEVAMRAAALIRQQARALQRVEEICDAYPPFFEGSSRSVCVECHDVMGAELKAALAEKQP